MNFFEGLFEVVSSALIDVMFIIFILVDFIIFIHFLYVNHFSSFLMIYIDFYYIKQMMVYYAKTKIYKYFKNCFTMISFGDVSDCVKIA